MIYRDAVWSPGLDADAEVVEEHVEEAVDHNEPRDVWNMELILDGNSEMSTE